MHSDNEIDFSYTVDGLARFRVNAFRQRGSVSIVARVIPSTVKTVAELGLPAAIEQIAGEERGLILLTGTTGSGPHRAVGGRDRPPRPLDRPHP